MAIIKSACPEISIPNVDIPTLLLNRSFPDDHPIFIDYQSKRKLTHKSIKDYFQRFGASLQDKWQWKKGDVMCIIAANNIEFAPVVWGVHCALGIVTPANPAYSVDELVHQLKNSNSKAIIASSQTLETARKAAEAVGIPFERILLMGQTPENGHQTCFSFLNNRLAESTRGLIKPEEDLAFICYSSGTTGPPKGVMLTHKNIVSNILQAQFIDFSQLRWQTDKIVGLLPFFHIYGLMKTIHLPMFNGIGVVVHQSFQLQTFLDSIQTYHLTLIHIVPPIILALAKDPLVSRYDLSSLRMIISGAAPLTQELQTGVFQRINVPVKQAYGLTETSPLVLSSPWDRWKISGSSGWLMPNMLLQFVDESGNVVARGETGELWVKGPNIMKGYLNNKEATDNSFSKDGWFKTGDIGRIDKDNNVFITDRAKELIKYKGFQVAPAELEGLLLSKTEISDVCVIGVYSEKQATELPRALCVLNSDVSPTPELEKEIMAFVAEKVAYYKQLRGGVRFIKEIPKSASGKILRRLLRNSEHGQADPEKARL